ncbi:MULTISPECIES: DUF5342 family protein [Paenibacillus]|uniref:DUF5342 family protein n=1 Tax=Paenibacillus TaxID=44249 RepID=UPI001FD1E6B2|nr:MULTISPECIES: DUF5342 family protein [Paenibacillus]
MLFENFDVIKPLFEDQVHERHQFSLNYQGNEYKGLYHNGEISWFNPHPQNDLAEEHLDDVESEVHERMQDHLS